jgi:hypothetical protein
MRWKIAAAIIFVAAVMVALFDVPYSAYWVYEMVRQGPGERQIYSLTPEIVEARCGVPTSEDTNTRPGPQNIATVSRNMLFNTTNGGSVLLRFSRTDVGAEQGKWVLGAMYDQVGHFRYDTPKSKFKALPCLKGG